MRGVREDRVPLRTCRAVRTTLYPGGRWTEGRL